MGKQEFLEELFEELEIESVEKLTYDIVLEDLEEFDSLAVMSIIALVHENFDLKLSAQDFKDFKTVGDLASKVGL